MTPRSTPRRVALRIGIAAALIVLSAGPAIGQPGPYRDVPELPAGPVGERVRQLLDTVNSGDPDRVRTLVAEAFAAEFREAVPMDRHLAVFDRVHRGSGGRLTFHGMRVYEDGGTPGEHVAILRNGLTETWEAFSLKLEEGPPHRIAELSFSPARPPHDAPAPVPIPDDAALARELERYVDRLAEAGAFSGSVLVARGDQVLLQTVRGEANRRYGVPNRVDTKFNLGSMNKMFTALSIARLVEQGKLSYSDPLSKWVGEDWLPKEITDKVRLEHLLTHTSGLGSYFNDTFFRSSRALYRELNDYKPLVAGETLAFEPGTDERYSNTGMFLLGVVLEKASGRNYFDLVRDEIYRPAGMTASDSYDMDRPVPNLAMGYTQEEGDWRENTFMHVMRGGPAGGGFSTAPDLLAFSRALTGGRLVSQETLAVVISAKPELGAPGYGYGFGVEEGPLGRVVGHGGGFPGISSNLDVFLDAGYTAVVLTNVDGGARPVQQKIRELLAAREAAE